MLVSKALKPTAALRQSVVLAFREYEPSPVFQQAVVLFCKEHKRERSF